MATKTKEIIKKASLSPGKNEPISHLSINFKENIKVNTSYYVYSGLTLIAEIGKKHALKKYDQFTLNTSCFGEAPQLCNFTKFLLQK